MKSNSRVGDYRVLHLRDSNTRDLVTVRNVRAPQSSVQTEQIWYPYRLVTCPYIPLNDEVVRFLLVS